MFDFLSAEKRKVITEHPELGKPFFAGQTDKNLFIGNLRAFARDLCSKELDSKIRFRPRELVMVIRQMERYPSQKWVGDIMALEDNLKAKTGHIGFTSTPWLSDKLREIEQLKPKAQIEFALPDDLDYRYFVAKLGEPDRLNEFGGLYCPKTRSIVIRRGYAAFEIGNIEPGVPYLKPRQHDDGPFDDVFFHTHPWSSNIFRNPIDSCRPSGTDLNSVLSCRMIEEEDGYERAITSLIGSRGFLSVTEAHGIRLDENTLYQNGLSQEQVVKIKEMLSLEPPIWTPNFAKNDEVRAELLALTRKFYHSRRTDRTKSYHQKVMEFKDGVKEIVRQGGLDKFIDEIVGHLPEYVSSNYLRNIGLSDNQARVVQEMTGIKTSVYQLVEGSGLKQIE